MITATTCATPAASSRCCARPAAAAPPAAASPGGRLPPAAAPDRLPPPPALDRPSARTHADQLDISPFPEILRAQRRHLAQLHHHQGQDIEATVSNATRAIYQALRDGTWIPGQRQRMQQLAPGTWEQALASVLSGSTRRQDDGPGHPVIEIAIYPDVVWLAARSLREHSTSHRAAS